MRVLIIGSGGREQAIAWVCRRDGHDVRLAPSLGHADRSDTDLVIPGPEAALVDGVADECALRDLPCFGPTKTLAQLESSKGYARELATSLGIPGPAFRRFTDELDSPDAAIAWYGELNRPVVVKLDGLAAGKGV
ncbi:MAG: phosphoribosylamine--glycine ligase, partial [Acidimicrobiia bacterium]|nr:phosphoribosylamine--glycine ligase [Acidimicrobiia bacterium]